MIDETGLNEVIILLAILTLQLRCSCLQVLSFVGNLKASILLSMITLAVANFLHSLQRSLCYAFPSLLFVSRTYRKSGENIVYAASISN